MKTLLVFLLVGLKGGKLLATGGSMLLSLAVYASIWGWPYAAGFIGLLLVHEMGHYFAARQRGLKVGAPMFIPFIGAWIALKEQPVDVETEAFVAFAGPFVGAVASLAVYLLARSQGSQLLLAIAYSGLLLNLFNLLPVSPLDGGRITAILSPRIWLLGAPVMLALLAWRPSPSLMLVAVISFPQLLKAWRYDPDDPANRAYYGVPNAVKLEYGFGYLALTALLGVMTYEVHQMLA